ncbi:Unknown protein sequence [Pseudomonas savastanoi pv. glycinea]|uniref:Uncharacterized protein n=1 Tax=Pseudomonas savastanoi pv. glycinea TaxID=318 RepID=A0ABR5L779_PSESG|nr:Unknown protein sequence [Pseudomonas savastanoi pv. glycinea]KPC34104.1 Unknown protein sequence [Pseudomonas savastanoi pv. glycinea]KPC37839.1 Unknown protein sequence [Pseudomonas savastanoi pv. glycinea]KPC40908.1 Unknown protein sequence [Pseudomonas savastanoi pv. glycinea]
MFTTAAANDQNIHFKNLDDADSGVRGVPEATQPPYETALAQQTPARVRPFF